MNRENKINVIVKKIDWQILEKEYASLEPTLYLTRREAVKRLKNQKAKLTSMATGLLLQKIVKDELGVAPEDLVISKGNYGKPYIEGCPEFCFNISHSGDVIAIAYGDSNVGVDVERIRCRENDFKVAKRCFKPEEYMFITDEAFRADFEGISHPTEERFFMVWTMKEAYLKYMGTGISVPMNSFEVKPYQGVVVGQNLNCQVMVMDDYVYSVCVDDGVAVSFNFE